ncbi:MAG: imidazolonepropionase [Bernardetiaceae bacterium]
MLTLTGPFTQLLTLDGLPLRGPIQDDQLQVINQGGICHQDGKILAIGRFDDLEKQYATAEIDPIGINHVCLPGFIDAHTHLCWDGTRAQDYADRNAGKTYLEIAAEGGGIWRSVRDSRLASRPQLIRRMYDRANTLLNNGVTTVEIKTGYGLSLESELRMLQAIEDLRKSHAIGVVSTCLAAHLCPRDFDGAPEAYLQYILDELVPAIEAQRLTRRFDIFVEQTAFTPEQALPFLQALRARGFDLTVHGDQFTTGGSAVAIAAKALSVDHLEASGASEIAALVQSSVIPVVLPGASLGLGMNFAPARKLLNAGCSLAIASDWNPGSAPQGDLLMQAAVLGAFEKLTNAEVLAGITIRAAAALGIAAQKGSLAIGKAADFITFACPDYREITYQQGALKPDRTWKLSPN